MGEDTEEKTISKWYIYFLEYTESSFPLLASCTPHCRLGWVLRRIFAERPKQL